MLYNISTHFVMQHKNAPKKDSINYNFSYREKNSSSLRNIKNDNEYLLSYS